MDALMKLDRLIDLFRAMDQNLPTQVVSVFLAVARSKEPLETRRLPDLTGMTQSSVNRALIYLQDTHWGDRKKPGLKLIIQKVHPLDARMREASLTPKGRKLAAQIEEIINDG